MAIPEYKTARPDVREVLYEVSLLPGGVYDTVRRIEWGELADALEIFGNVSLQADKHRSRVRIAGEDGKGAEMPENMEAYLSGRKLEITPVLKVAGLGANVLFAMEAEANGRGKTIIPIAVDPADGCSEIIEKDSPYKSYLATGKVE
jgi:hypothetical protein